MASSWGDVVSKQADQISDRLRQLASSGLHFLRDELGVDLGLKPELYAAWVIPTTALIGLVLLLVLVAACGGSWRRKHGVARSKSAPAEVVKAPPVKAPKADEPKKKTKKKSAEKKNQSNGGTVPEPREQVKAVKEVPKQASAPPPAPAAPAAPAAAPAAARPPQRQPRQPQPPPQPPSQTSPQSSPQPQAPANAKDEKAKKSKKKPKPEVKPTQAVSSTDGKEPDEGAWETKISNREKRQQRKKEKGSNDESGSPGSGQHAGQQAEQQPAAPVNTKKNKESQNLKAAKTDASISPVLSTWNNVSSVNTGGRTDMSVKHPPQVNPSDRNKSSAVIKTTGHRTSETFSWAQESNGSWSNVDGRSKPEVNRMNFSMPRLNQSAAGVPVSQPSSAELGNGHPIADEWSGFNGVGAVDPSSDWNAPTELWGNYDEPKPEKPAAQETSVSQLQESDDDKDKGDPSGSSKSKRKKKKKKKPEDETAGSQVNIENSSVPAECGSVKPRPHVPVEESTKQILAPQSGQSE
ncbi:protein LYRIC isoform X3 [Silurus meridionalis]|nr:protein LYRIC isoform X3 [Silurus meridionalis]